MAKQYISSSFHHERPISSHITYISKTSIQQSIASLINSQIPYQIDYSQINRIYLCPTLSSWKTLSSANSTESTRSTTNTHFLPTPPPASLPRRPPLPSPPKDFTPLPSTVTTAPPHLLPATNKQSTIMMPYSIHEPSPTYPSTMTYGRGGAGNRTSRPLPPTTLKATATHALHTTHPQNHGMPNYSTGRGGVGNMHNAGEERCMFSFDEELAKQGKATASPVYHIGRGGQGNAVHDRRESDASSGSDGSSARGSVKGSLDWVRGLARGSKS